MVSEKQLRKRKLVAHSTSSGQQGRVRSSTSTSTSGPSSRGGGSSSRGRGSNTNSRGRGRGGFHVGPTHAPAGSYLGRAKKIKEELIAKAKTKKAYYALLKRDGMSVPERRSRGAEGAGEGKGVGGKDDFFDHGSQDGGDDDDGTDAGDGDEDEDEDQEDVTDEQQRHRPPTSRFTLSHDTAEEDQDKPSLDPLRMLEEQRAARTAAAQRKSKKVLAAEAKQTGDADGDDLSRKRRRDVQEDGARGSAKRRAEEEVVMHRHFNNNADATSTSESSKRTNHPKQQADHQPERSKPEERQRQREAWNKLSNSARGRARGQPDLGARVGVMLERIEAKALGVGAGAPAGRDGGGGGEMGGGLEEGISERNASSFSPTTMFRLPSLARSSFSRIYPATTTTTTTTTTRIRMSSTWVPPGLDAIPAPPAPVRKDMHSLSNIAQIHPKHIHLDWEIDWTRKVIFGSVTHKIGIDEDGLQELVLDSSYLDLGKITVDGLKVEARVAERQGSLGSALRIPLSAPAKKGDAVEVKIEYSTTQQSTALGWLTKEQTLSKKGPFLYSQCQAIHARSLLPCIDSPSHRTSYTATVKSAYPVLMSALNDNEFHKESASKHDPNTYHFKQPQRIPSYLIAIISAVLEFRSLGSRVGVWAEPSVADQAQWEFEADAERFLKAAEETVSPYSWERYDSIVLPPAFPYGGMENPNAVTLTPAVIVGNRMQVDVLLHELMHSWSGNLTTNADWRSFFLNESFCVYLERLVLQVVHGKEEGPAYRGFSYIMGAKALRDSRLGFKDTPRFQRLVPVYEHGEDPDDAFSSVPYEGGSNLLLYIENLVGGLDNFLPYVRAYFHTFYDRSVTVEEWKSHLLAYFASSPELTQKITDNVDFDAWLHGEGVDLPVDMTPYYDDTLARAAWALAARWVAFEGQGGKKEEFGKHDIEAFNASQIVVFLEKLHSGPDVPPAVVKKLDEAYDFSNSNDGEILLRFYEVALEVEAGTFAPKAAKWVQTVGRMKYVRPVYRALRRVDEELAVKTFNEAKEFYHPICRALLVKDLGLA